MSVVDDLLDKAKDVVNLEIITVVANPKVKIENNRIQLSATTDDLKDSQTIYSNINLIDGDITRIIPEVFYKPESNLAAVRQIHQSSEDQGREIIASNIKALEQLAQLTSKLLKLKNGNNDDPAAN